MSKRVLFIVEGRKTESTFLKRLLSGLGITDEHRIFVFGTNIHVLYGKVFGTGDPEAIDLLGALREGAIENERGVLSQDFSDIYLVFDAEFQDPRFDLGHLRTMLEYFDNSTENGRLYLNYPMMESYLHLKSMNDPGYLTRTVSYDSIKDYKRIARLECCKELSNASHYSRRLILVIVSHNYMKTYLMLGMDSRYDQESGDISDQGQRILQEQSDMLRDKGRIQVLNTSAFLALEHDPRILSEILEGPLKDLGFPEETRQTGE